MNYEFLGLRLSLNIKLASLPPLKANN